jgi:hypothetical protein
MFRCSPGNLGFIIVSVKFNAPLGFESRYSGIGTSNGVRRHLPGVRKLPLENVLFAIIKEIK